MCRTKIFHLDFTSAYLLDPFILMSLSDSTISELNRLLEGLISTENEPRRAAEEALEREWRSPGKVDILLLYLANNSVESSNETLRSFCAVLFRRLAIRSPKKMGTVIDRTIAELDEQVKLQIRDVLLRGFVAPQSGTVRRKLADAIAEVAKEDCSPPGLWPSLLPTLFEAVTSQTASMRECAFRVFSSCPEIIDSDLVPKALSVFEAGFDDTEDDVRISACTAFVSYFRESPKKVWLSMSPLLPSLLNSLPRFLSNGKDDALANVLENLIELVEMAPKMFKDMFPVMIEFCSTVCKNRDLDGSARLAALELMTMFSEVSPGMCRLTATYSSTMVLVNLALLTEVSIDDEEAADWNNNDNTEDDEDEPEYEAARQSLDRISLNLGGQAIAGPLFQYLPDMCHSLRWRECFAALMALSAAAEGCTEVLINEIPKLLDLVLPCINHPHPRVQFACSNALGQISTDFAGIIQRTSGDRILPALISKLTQKSVFKVQKHSAAALVNFCEAAPNEVLEPYLDDLLNNLLALLLSPKRYVQEQVLSTIAIIADAAQKKFLKYHDTLLPMLIEFLRSTLGDESRALKAKCIECATLIGLAVGKEHFNSHIQIVIDLLILLQEECSESDDPLKSHLEQGWVRICKLIGKDFVPYLPIVIPPLLQTARAAQDVSLLEEEEAEEFNNSDEWDVINLSGKLIAVHTAALDEKVTAMDLLREYSAQLNSDFYPWVADIAENIAIPALDFYLHDGVRASASLTLASVLRSSVYANGTLSHESTNLWNQICMKLSGALINEPVPEVLVAYYTSLIECVDIMDLQLFVHEQLSVLTDSLLSNLSQIFERVKYRDSEDDQFTEDVDEDQEEFTDEELLNEINRVISTLFKKTGDLFVLHYQKLLSSIVETFIVDENSSVKLCGLSIVCDLFEFCRDSNEQVNYLKFIISDCLTTLQAEIRQGAAHAIGIAAQHKGVLYVSLLIECLPLLFQVATFPDAKAEENLRATESCLSAIALICKFHTSAILNLEQIITQWLNLLPVLHDEEAAVNCYEFLLVLISSQHAVVKKNLEKVIESIMLALSHKSVTGKLAADCVEAAKAMLGSIPRNDAIRLLSGFTDQELINSYFKS